MPFGLANTYWMLKPFISKFVDVYLNDILIYSTTLKDHLLHIEEVFYVLQENKLYINNLKKCELFSNELQFLGFIVGEHGIRVDEKKVITIWNWPPSKIMR